MESAELWSLRIRPPHGKPPLTCRNLGLEGHHISPHGWTLVLVPEGLNKSCIHIQSICSCHATSYDCKIDSNRMCSQASASLFTNTKMGVESTCSTAGVFRLYQAGIVPLFGEPKYICKTGSKGEGVVPRRKHDWFLWGGCPFTSIKDQTHSSTRSGVFEPSDHSLSNGLSRLELRLVEGL